MSDLGVRPGLPDVAARHPQVPGMLDILDDERRTALLEGLVPGRYVVSRLRLKRDRSLSAALAPAEGQGPWLLARAVRHTDWETKAAKDIHSVTRRGTPAVIRTQEALLVAGAAADRRLRPLARLRPDSGETATVAGCRRIVRTLSYNPARRWVGRATDSQGETVTVRLHAGQQYPQFEEWVEGRPFAQAPDADVDRLAACLADALGRRAQRPPRHDVLRAVAVIPDALDDIEPRWGARARRLVRRLHDDPTPFDASALAHGDLSADQVVVADDGTLHILDWDRHGFWPVGWDTATWLSDGVMTGVVPAGSTAPLLGASPHPTVVAAAALLRLPDPFRRQRDQWVDETARLFDHAETVMS